MSRHHRSVVCAAILLSGAAAPALAGADRDRTTQRVSVSSAGEPGNGPSFNPELSFGGRYLLFNANATNLVAGDTNGTTDVFLRDRRRGQTELVSVSSAGVQADRISDATFLSYDGRYALFQSQATNLVAGDTNNLCDVFLRDLQRRTTVRISVGPGGAEGDDCSFASALSATGRFVAANSFASNLARGTGSGRSNLLVYDRRTGARTLETVGPAGEPSDAPKPSRISAFVTFDGRYVGFHSVASNLVHGDGNGAQQDVFRRNRRSRRTELVSVAADGGPANGPSLFNAMTEDGNLIVFSSAATNLVPGGTTPQRRHVYLRDMRAGRTVRLDNAVDGGEPDGSVGSVAAITPFGRLVFFNSIATNLVEADANGFADSFVLDRRTGRTTLVSLAATGAQGNANVAAGFGDIAPGGRAVAFVSAADNLVAGDVPGSVDVFVRDLAPRR